MKNEDPLSEVFKNASEKQIPKNFDSMEQIWNRLETKLNAYDVKNQNTFYKKMAVAAAVFLVAFLGYELIQIQFKVFNKEKIIAQTNANLKLELKVKLPRKPKLIASNNPKIDYKKINQLKNNPKKQQNQLVTQIENRAVISNAEVLDAEKDVKKSKSSCIAWIKSKSTYNESSNIADRETEKKMASTPQKESKPSAVPSNSEADVAQARVKKAANYSTQNWSVEFEKIKQLNNPLYVINGIYYTENDVINSTSKNPYYPLQRQKIESITILSPTTASEIYGQKGKNGVVVITTNNNQAVED